MLNKSDLSPIVDLLKRHKTQIFTVAATFIVCVLFASLTKYTPGRADVPWAFLLISASLFFTLLIAKFYAPSGHKLVCFLSQRDLIVGTVIVCSMASNGEVATDHPLAYNLSATLLLAMMVLQTVRFIERNILTAGFNLSFKKQRIYLLYLSGIIGLFTVSFYMDETDPYGPFFIVRIVSALLLVHLLLSWVLNQWKLVGQLQTERIEAELLHLKSQVNPHFLFNTLNNLYGLALEKSDQAPDVILKLSDMLRYTIYQGAKDLVPLTDEIAYLQNYIELQKIRSAREGRISFTHTTDNTATMIAPLLLIILLENAFKHGFEKLIEDKFIELQLGVEEGKLTFTIKNNFSPVPHPREREEKGIGLKNLAKRLELIYPECHKLACEEVNATYMAALEIDISVGSA